MVVANRQLRSSILPFAVGTVASKGMDRLGTFLSNPVVKYLFFATIETVATSVIIWQAWTWSGVEATVSSERIVRQPEAGITSS